MTATCPVDLTHRAFHASDKSGQIVCWTCQSISKAKRANKYGARKVETPLGTADSVKEGARIHDLILLERAGRITELAAHPAFDLIAWSPSGPRKIGRYTADAAYREDGRMVVEDTKSPATKARQDYSLRRRIFLANHPEIEFRET